MFDLFGGGYHVFIVTISSSFCLFPYVSAMIVLCEAMAILESKILWMEVEYASALLKFYESSEVVAKLIFVCSFDIVYLINVPLLFNNNGLICTILLCLVTWHYK